MRKVVEFGSRARRYRQGQWDLDFPFIAWSRQAEWTIRNTFQGLLILGATGSGKSGSGHTTAAAPRWFRRLGADVKSWRAAALEILLPPRSAVAGFGQFLSQCCMAFQSTRR
jgi:hypothetical protein